MSRAAQAQEQYGTRLRCTRCGAHGYATWEVATEDSGTDALGTVVRITSGFFVRGTDKQGNLEIACLKCGS